MKKSKKGITLVELVICCAITVMLAGACTAVLISGQRVWNSGSKSANAQMTADIVQTSLYGKLPHYSKVEVEREANETDYNSSVGSTNGTVLFFNDEGLVIRNDGKNMILDDVTDMTVSLLKVGSKESARSQFNYTVTLEDGREFSGGIVVSNLRHKNEGEDAGVILDTVITLENMEDGISLRDHAIWFYNDPPAAS